MSTQLVTIQPTNFLALVPAGHEETFDIYKNRRPSIMALVQPTTTAPAGVVPGKFWDRKLGDQLDQLEMVIMGITKPRSKYPSATFVRGEKPICKSRDGKTPITDDDRLTPQADACNVCPHASWKGYNNKTKTGKKPTCKDSRRIYFVDRVQGLPYLINVNGTGIKTVDQLQDTVETAAIKLNRQLKMQGKDRKLRGEDFVVTIIAERAKDGPYYDFKPIKVQPMSEEEAAEYKAIKLAMEAGRAEFEAQMEAEEAAAAVAEATAEIVEEPTGDEQI